MPLSKALMPLKTYGLERIIKMRFFWTLVVVEAVTLFCGAFCYLQWFLNYPAPANIRKDRDGAYRRYHRAVKLRHAAWYIFLPLGILLFSICLHFFPNTWLHDVWYGYFRMTVYVALILNYITLGRWYHFGYEAKVSGYKVALDPKCLSYLILPLCVSNLINLLLIMYTVHRYIIGDVMSTFY